MPTAAARTPTPVPSTPTATGIDGPTGPTGPTEQARVTSVSDGDTIHVSIGGRDYRVRYIGMNAPELDCEGQPAEVFAQESLMANRQLVKDEAVTLEKDVSETDRYGRLLRYVWLGADGSWLLVNAELVRLGFAHAGTYPPDVKYTDLMRAAEQEARNAGAGLWGDARRNINPIAQPIPDRTPKPRAPQPPSRDCDPSYPDVCISSSPPDLDCGDISFRRFAVRPPDPHRFDGDGDGIGCES